MIKWLSSIGKITWDGIIQAIATLIVVFLALFLDKIRKNRNQQRKIKDLGSILNILITIPVQNVFMLETLYRKLSNFDENILQTLGMFLINDNDALGEIISLNQYNPAKFPLIFCNSNINYPCLIAYPNFQNWRSKSNIYSLPGSLTAFGGTLMQLSPMQEEKDRKRIWESVKKQGKNYGIKLEQRNNFQEWKSQRRTRKRAKVTYFKICIIIRSILSGILLNDSLWARKLHYYAHKIEYDRLVKGFMPINKLNTEKGAIQLNYYIFNQGKLFSNSKNSLLDISGYHIALDGMYNSDNAYNLRNARREQLGLAKNQELNQIEKDIIAEMSKFTPSKKIFQFIMNKWINSVGYCRVPRRYKKILPLGEVIRHKLKQIMPIVKEHLQFFIHYRKLKFRWMKQRK